MGQPKQGVLALVIYLGLVYVFVQFRTPPPIEELPPSFARLVLEVSFGVVVYDFLYFWVHYALHRTALGRLFRHQEHHDLHCSKLCAHHVVQHSLSEGFLQVAVNILVQQWTPIAGPKHKLSRYAHNIVVTYLLTESHAGYDGPWCVHRLWPAVFGGAYRHELHHRSGRCCFHQFFRYLDDLLGVGPPREAADEAETSRLPRSAGRLRGFSELALVRSGLSSALRSCTSHG